MQCIYLDDPIHSSCIVFEIVAHLILKLMKFSIHCNKQNHGITMAWLNHRFLVCSAQVEPKLHRVNDDLDAAQFTGELVIRRVESLQGDLGVSRTEIF